MNSTAVADYILGEVNNPIANVKWDHLTIYSSLLNWRTWYSIMLNQIYIQNTKYVSVPFSIMNTAVKSDLKTWSVITRLHLWFIASLNLIVRFNSSMQDPCLTPSLKVNNSLPSFFSCKWSRVSNIQVLAINHSISTILNGFCTLCSSLRYR